MANLHIERLCAPPVLWDSLLYYYCTAVVLLLYYYCATVVLLLYYYCTTILLLLYYYCTTVSALWRLFNQAWSPEFHTLHAWNRSVRQHALSALLQLSWLLACRCTRLFFLQS